MDQQSIEPEPESCGRPIKTVAEAVAEAIAQVERGEVYEVTDELWAEIAADAHAAMLRGEPARDEIRYSPVAPIDAHLNQAVTFSHVTSGERTSLAAARDVALHLNQA